MEFIIYQNRMLSSIKDNGPGWDRKVTSRFVVHYSITGHVEILIEIVQLQRPNYDESV